MQNPTIEQLKNFYAYKAKQAKDLFLHNAKRFLEFPYYAEPKISIIILGYNKSEYTFRCLESLLTYADVPFELILVDNASSDDTRLLFSRVKNATTILNDENLFFIRGNNQAAALAKAPYLLFLNNDTEISANTLSELLQTIETEEKCGAVGCKLILQDGTIQEAGSIFWANGNNHEYCRGYNPVSAECSYLREADYCGGACLLVRKDLFQTLEGFSAEWEPAYYEETDLCASIRKLGYRVLFQPSTYVFHNENTSWLPERAKELCKQHSDKFDVKWRSYLKSIGYGLYTGDDILEARDRRKIPTLLIIVKSTEPVLNNNFSDLTLEKVKNISKQYKTTLISLDKNPDSVAVDVLEKSGIEVFYGASEFAHLINGRKNFYDEIVVFATEKHPLIKDIQQQFVNAHFLDVSNIDSLFLPAVVKN
jgi:GT2 family glycosyltransferase